MPEPTTGSLAVTGVRCTLMRGGTSKGAYFLASDLPADPAVRDDLLLRIMGTPDPRQIDGLGGAHSITSKVAIVSPATESDRDVDYLFLQLGVDEPTVSDRIQALRTEAVGHDLFVAPPMGRPVEVEHPAGKVAVAVELDHSRTPPRVRRSTVIRTARKLFDGTVFPRT